MPSPPTNIRGARRRVTAERRVEQAQAARTRAELGLAEIEAEQRRVAAETDDLEARARVVRDAVPLTRAVPRHRNGRWRGAKPRARWARRHGCCAWPRASWIRRLPSSTPISRAGCPRRQAPPSCDAAPIDEALRLRSACLHGLTLTRRAATRPHLLPRGRCSAQRPRAPGWSLSVPGRPRRRSNPARPVRSRRALSPAAPRTRSAP